MEISVTDLPPGGRRFAGTAALKLEADADEVRASHPVAFGIWAIRDGGEVHVRGWVSTRLAATCGRCLDSFALRVRREFEVTYRARSEDAIDGVTELDDDDLDLDYYRGQAIDIRALLAEQLLLALPMKILCDDDCEGLCPQCGINRNRQQCECRPAVDPRLASLAAIRDRL